MAHAPSRVLIIDDEKGVVQLCQRLLERRGFQVKSALTPLDGLGLLDQAPVDLLLVDIKMPGMDGFQVMQRARQMQPNLAVLMITGHGTIELAVQALHGGADGLALKPFTAEELLRSVEQAIEQNHRKREMSRLHTLQPLFEFSTQLFSELTPSRLRRLVVESIVKHLSGTASLLIKLPANRQPSATRLSNAIQKQIFYQGTPPDAHTQRELGQALAQLAVQCLQNQAAAQSSMQNGRGINLLMAAPVPLCIPAPATDRSNTPGDLAGPRRLDDTHNWLILAAVRGRFDEEGSVSNSVPIKPFTIADQDLLSIVSHQAAKALENAMLNSELRAHIRKLKESQRLLLQAEKMAAAGRLMASIAHEINNPLQAVQNCIHLAHRSDLPLQSRQDYLQLAQGELERLTKTVQHMLDFYRPASIDREATDINQALTRVIHLMSQKLDENRIEVSLLFDPDLPPVYTVTDQIQQVFLNLILNAIEAMPGGGKLEVSTLALPKKWVEINIQDTGPGVNPKIRKRIFDPFTSAKAGGIGLGLSISYGIISAHGGSLELVEDDPKNKSGASSAGAHFRVRLPVE